MLTGLFAGTALLAGLSSTASGAATPCSPCGFFRSRAFSGINAASLLMFLGMFGSIFLLSQYMQGVLGYSRPRQVCGCLPWRACRCLSADRRNPLRPHRRPPGRRSRSLSPAAGLGYLAKVATTDVAYSVQLPGLIISGIGMALFFAPASNLVMSSVLPREQGIASGRQQRTARGRRALGIAVMSSIFTARGGYGSAQLFVDGLRRARGGLRGR